MSIFNKRKKISFIALEHLIEETSKNTLQNILNTLNNIEQPFEEMVAKINVISINYELSRYALYKSNDRKDVDEILEDLYSQIFYIVQVDSSEKETYNNYIEQVISKSKQIFDVKKLEAPAQKFVYRLLLEQLSIREDKIDLKFIPELLFYAESWVNNMKAISDTYSIDTSEEGRKSDNIDFNF